MVLEIELIQFYRCKSLDELLERASRVFEQLGFPFLTLTWTPAPGPVSNMRSNYTMIWDNYSERIGPKGADLKLGLAESLAIALNKSKSDTQACQAWKVRQTDSFLIVADAPSDFFLTGYQKRLLSDFGEPEWTEFCAYPLCKERDRTLVLIAKTQRVVSSSMIDALRTSFEVFANAYRCLHSNALASAIAGPGATAEEILSRREVECLQWLASGKTFFEAAKILGISERTLRFHVTNARERLGVSTTVQAIVSAALAYGFDPHDGRRSVYATARSQIS